MKIKLLSQLGCLSLVLCFGFSPNSQAQSASKLGFFKMPKNIKASDYLPNTINFKLKSQFANNFSAAKGNAAFKSVLAKLGTVQLTQKFPNSSKPNLELKNSKQVDITTIYALHYTSNADLSQTINAIYASGMFEYVEPHYVQHFSYIPDDPSAMDSSNRGQYHLYRIKAIQAWNLFTGDTATVVGITDTGVEFAHPDLKENIKYNYADPINGKDDDNDGYVDNFKGWDVGVNDNDPQWQGNSHGVHVSGLAGASTNNKLGVAGTGYNCKFLPIKIADEAGNLIASYEGITYAADHGCKVINCSWGGGSNGRMGQDVIDYATFNKNALVVVAAGNDGGEVISYPAAYENVLCVASTGFTDARSGFTSYGFHVDVCAPGSNILSTLPPNIYGQESGTSMASPVTAGAAALLRSRYPSYSPLQIAGLLKATADTIYQIPQNTALRGKLGTGRINLYRAITETNIRFAELLRYNITDNNDEAFVTGDTLSLSANFFNYFDALKSSKVIFSTVATTVNLLNPVIDLGDIASADSVNIKNKVNALKIVIKAGAAPNSIVTLDVKIYDQQGRVNYQRISFTINVDYINYHENDISVTITSNSRLGYKSDQQKDGIGFKYKDFANMLYDGGLMVGVNASKVSDNLRALAAAQDADFASTSVVKRLNPTVRSKSDLESEFADSKAAAGKAVPVRVRQRTFAYDTPGNTKYVIVEYNIKNRGTSDLNDLYAGICMDWDIDTPTVNKIKEDAARKMGYTYSSQSNGLYAGIKVLSSNADWKHYAIDNDASGQGGIVMTDGFSPAEKYQALSNNRAEAGVNGSGNDVIDVVSTGPFNNIAPNDSVVVAFALIAGEDVKDIQKSADSAQAHYKTTKKDDTGIADANGAGFGISNLYPNPANSSLSIQLDLNTNKAAALYLYDMQGKRIAEIWSSVSNNLGKQTIVYSTENLAAGIYHVSLQVKGEKELVKKLVIIK